MQTVEMMKIVQIYGTPFIAAAAPVCLYIGKCVSACARILGNIIVIFSNADRSPPQFILEEPAGNQEFLSAR